MSRTKIKYDRLTEQFSFDPKEKPSPVRDVLVLKGNWYEIGKQYGSRAKHAVERDALAGLSIVMDMFSEEEAQKFFDIYTEYFNEKAPEIMELYRGMAEGAELSYEAVMLGLLSYTALDKRCFCSNMAAWGKATEDGRLIAGANWDTCSFENYYVPAVMVYPEGGHAFVTNCGFITNCVMNDAGVVVMGSSGQAANDEDCGMGLPAILTISLIAAKAGSAEEAKALYINQYFTGEGDNFHVADKEGNSFVVEHTACKTHIRQAGDFGEKDYTVAVNDFMIEEMKNSLFSGEMYDDNNRVRYWTEEKMILDNFGSVNLDTVANALGSIDFYIKPGWESEDWKPGVDKAMISSGWQRDVWDLDNCQGFWTPENREPLLKVVTRGIADPSNRKFYIMKGCKDTPVSMNPEATGNFMHLLLSDDVKETVKEAHDYALVQIWLGGRDISRSSKENLRKEEYLNMAKSAFLAGESYASLMKITLDESKKLEFAGEALTEYCKAQCFAQSAQEDSSKILRDGEDYKLYM